MYYEGFFLWWKKQKDDKQIKYSWAEAVVEVDGLASRDHLRQIRRYRSLAKLLAAYPRFWMVDFPPTTIVEYIPQILKQIAGEPSEANFWRHVNNDKKLIEAEIKVTYIGTDDQYQWGRNDEEDHQT